MSKSWVITTLKAPASIITRDLIDKLGLNTATTSAAGAGSQAAQMAAMKAAQAQQAGKQGSQGAAPQKP